MPTQNLLQPFKIGTQTFANRVFMAPLTRCRASAGHVPNALMAEYYAQRATAGLLIAEATMIEEGNSAFIAEPGIYNQEQVEGWKLVTSKVHAAGGKIYLQIWHGGRACHPDINGGKKTVSASAIAIDGETFTPGGMKKHVVPREIPTAEVKRYVDLFKQAAVGAKEAGFDGVEIHAANGYLIDQFLRDGSNKRTDEYGGSLENRLRFLTEITNEVISVFGADRVGVRISPLNSYNSMKDSNPVKLTKAVCKTLSAMNVGYLHLMRADFLGVQSADLLTVAREHFKGALIGNMGFSVDEAEVAVTERHYAAIAFGKPFISNPDLVTRIQKRLSLAEPKADMFYTPGPHGYTDYPAVT